MKLTKSQLKQLIKEELQAVLSEVVTPTLPYDKAPFVDAGGHFGSLQLDMLEDPRVEDIDEYSKAAYQMLLDHGLNPEINIYDVIEGYDKAAQWWNAEMQGRRFPDKASHDEAKAAFIADWMNKRLVSNAARREEDERAYEAERDPSL